MAGIREKADLYLDTYEYINNVFQKNFGYTLYFIGGTLLGYVRENDFLENDKDMDVSYFSKYNNVLDVKQEMIEICEKLIELEEPLIFIRSGFTTVKYFIKYKIKNTEDDRIDIMPTWIQNGKIYRPTFVGYNGSKDIIFPLKKEKFYNHDVFIPNRAEEKLANVYGENWRIPDRGFKKKKRLDRDTTKVITKQLYYGDECRYLVKKTKQWNVFSPFMKLMLQLILMRRHAFVSRILPKSGKIKRFIFKKLNSIKGKK